MDLLACPGCQGRLGEDARQALACQACGKSYPRIGKLPWLYPDPDAKLAEWHSLIQIGLDDYKRQEERLKAAQRQPQLRETTLKRLRHELQARVEHRKAVETLIAPLIRAEGAGVDTLRVLSRKAASTQSLTSYNDNAIRDWGWPDTDENRLALELVTSVLGDAPRGGAMAALGVGAARLPYDLHRALGLSATVAVDINPFLLFVADRMVQGKSLALQEFPLAPDGLAATAVARKLAAPGKADAGFHLLFGDVLNAPLAEGRFDLVLTPWLVDILPEEPQHFLARVNRLLKPGGVWLNFGSVAFTQGSPERHLSRDELLEIVDGTGFRMKASRLDRIPYLASPASCQARHEKVLTFAAVKTAEAPAPLPYQSLPPWLLDPTQPMPKSEALSNMQGMHAYYAEVLGLIDGQRSAADVALHLAAKYGLEPAQARQAVIGFYANMREIAR